MASPFASLTVSDPIELPFDPGQWVKVRKLTGRQHEEAQASHRGAFVAGRTNAWAVTFRRALEHGAAPSDAEVLKAIADPLTGYDRYALVKAGLVEWSYPQAIADAIDDLDDDAVDFIAREVLRRTKPGLFLASDDWETARKNDSRPCTVA